MNEAQVAMQTVHVIWTYKEIAIAIAIVWVIGAGVGIWSIGRWALEAIGRNPSVSGEIKGLAILYIAFAEAVAIYALVISLIIWFDVFGK